MSGVLYEVEVTRSSDQPIDTGTWLDNLLRQVLENEGFESGRAYRNAATHSTNGHHLALQFRVRSEAELDRWSAISESALLSDVSTHCGEGSKVITRRLLAASELATPSDAAGDQTVTECPNCGARVVDKFCASCGQDNNVSVVAFHRLLGDFFRDFFNFDSRLFNSIWPLIGKPGFLTVEYLAGRRATYLPPVRMTLFLSIIFFALVAWQADRALVTVAKAVADPKVAASTEAPLLEVGVDDDDRIELTSADSGWLKVMEDRASTNLHRLGNDGEYQRDVLQKAIDYLPVMMFVLMPVFAFILKVLHVRSGRYYVEHLIHSLHVHAFNFLTLGLIVGLSMVSWVRAAWDLVPSGGGALWWTWFCLYPWLAMKRVYRQGFFKTTVKFGISSLLYAMLLAVGTVATAVVSLSV